MEAAGWGVYARGSGKGREANGDAKAANRDDGGAGALENGKPDRPPTDDFGVEIQDQPLPT